MYSWASTTEIALCATDCSASERLMPLRWYYVPRCPDRHPGRAARQSISVVLSVAHRGTSGGGSVTCRGDGGVQLLLGAGLEYGYDYAYTFAWVAVVEYQARSHQPSVFRRLRVASVPPRASIGTSTHVASCTCSLLSGTSDCKPGRLIDTTHTITSNSLTRNERT